jgi:NAD(P)H-flavin reductase
MAQHGQAIAHDFCGAIRLTRDEKRHHKLAQHAARSPADWLEQLTQDQASDLSGHQVYACGAPIVVDSARADYIGKAGLPEEAFFADSFTTEADKAKESA